MTAASHEERLLELLADRAVQPLSEDEEAELQSLLAEHPDTDDEAMERAAAATTLAYVEEEPMPEELRERLHGAAAAWQAQQSGRPQPVESSRPAGRRPAALTWGGWVAAAAALVLAVVGYWPAIQPAPSPEEQMQQLVASDQSVITYEWSATEDPAVRNGLQGRVVWSQDKQRGYMTFEGLAANNPSQNVYQLWIFDEGRQKYPVDGGVFNVPSAQDRVVVPIDAKLPVKQPKLFAVTVEPPGGVVVSDQERIVATAGG